MDLKSAISYIANHYIVITGTTLALFFTASMILLIRSIGEKSERSGGSGADLDVKAIEGALKRVLSTQPVSIMAASADLSTASVASDALANASASGSVGDETLKAALSERDTKIATLTEELAVAKAAVDKAGESPSGGANAEQLAALNAKIEELQGRLTEYEIIEDDIADLSMFKEENSRLKDELANLKKQQAAQTPIQPTAPPTVSTAVSSPASPPEPQAAQPVPVQMPPETMMPQTPIAVESTELNALEPSIKFEKVEGYELDPNDDVMKEFAAAVEYQRAPTPPSVTAVPPMPTSGTPQDPQAAIDALLFGANATIPNESPNESEAAIDTMLSSSGASVTESINETVSTTPPASGAIEVDDILSGTPDPDKLLNEVESIGGDTAVDSGDALEESLDTDKLLAEVDSLNKGA